MAPLQNVGRVRLALGSLSRSIGTTANFATVTTSGSGILTNTLNGASGILGGWATTSNGTEWARVNGVTVSASGLQITGGAAYVHTASTTNTSNEDMTSSLTLNPGVTMGSLRFNTATASTLTLNGAITIATGGILVTNNVAGNTATITGGTSLTSGNGPFGDLIAIVNGAGSGLNISSPVVNGITATGLTKAGAGLLTLGAMNTFTGGIFISGGTVMLNSPGALNASGINTVSFGNDVGLLGTSSASGQSLAGAPLTGTLRLNGNSVMVAGISDLNVWSGTSRIDDTSAYAATLTVNATGTSSSTFAGVIADGTGGGALALTKSGSGALTLAGVNTYTGGTTVGAGTLELAPSGQLPAGSSVMVTGSGVLSGTGRANGAVTVGGGGTISPGSNTVGAIGILTVGSAAFQPGGTFLLDLARNPTGGSAGVNWDSLAVSGALDLSGLTSSSSFTIKLQSADPTLFNPSQSYTWLSVINAGSVTPPVAVNWFGVDASAFATGVTGTFSLVADGPSFDLNYASAIPEPSTFAVLAGLGVLSLAGRRRRADYP